MSERLTTEVKPGNTEILVPDSYRQKDLYLRVDGNGTDGYLGRTVDSARSQERLVKDGDRGPLKVPERGEKVYAHVPNSASNSVKFILDNRGFFFNLDPRFSQDVSGAVNLENSAGATVDPATKSGVEDVDAALGNWASLTADSYATAGTTAEQLPAHAVPDGADVLLQADESNGGVVNVGDSASQPITLNAGESFNLSVSNTDAIYVQTPTTGDSVGILLEDN